MTDGTVVNPPPLSVPSTRRTRKGVKLLPKPKKTVAFSKRPKAGGGKMTLRNSKMARSAKSRQAKLGTHRLQAKSRRKTGFKMANLLWLARLAKKAFKNKQKAKSSGY